MLALIITDSTGETHIHPIAAEEGRCYTLGRSPECDIALTEEIHLSRTHCLFTVYGTQLYLQDNNSSNGVFAGSRKITAEYMATEREYTMGKCSVVLIRTQQADDSDSAPSEAFAFEDEDTSPSSYTATDEAPAPEAQETAEEIPETHAEYEEFPTYAKPLLVGERLPSFEYTTTEEELPAFSDETSAEENPTYAEQPAAEPPPAVEIPSPEEPPAPSESPAVPESETAEQRTSPPAAEVSSCTPAEAPRLRCRKVEPRKLPGIHKVEKEKPQFRTRSFRTAAGTAGGAPAAQPVKQLRTPSVRTEPHVHYKPGVSGEALSLPTDFELELRLLNTTADLPIGTPLKFGVNPAEECYIYLLHYDCLGKPCLLVPGVAGEDNRGFAGCEMQFPRACNNEYELIVEPPLGQEMVIAVACTERTDFASVWKKLSKKRTRPGRAEKTAIKQIGAKDARWASAILVLDTSPKEQ